MFTQFFGRLWENAHSKDTNETPVLSSGTEHGLLEPQACNILLARVKAKYLGLLYTKYCLQKNIYQQHSQISWF
ncbi:Protein of unknown function [Gryllus bimaculatus]|nr:Protein of unknown function [Gryllus bimaculatus]